jgi:hypothetical protein
MARGPLVGHMSECDPIRLRSGGTAWYEGECEHVETEARY